MKEAKKYNELEIRLSKRTLSNLPNMNKKISEIIIRSAAHALVMVQKINFPVKL